MADFHVTVDFDPPWGGWDERTPLKSFSWWIRSVSVERGVEVCLVDLVQRSFETNSPDEPDPDDERHDDEPRRISHTVTVPMLATATVVKHL